MSDDNKSSTLWIGNIEPWMDDKYVINLFSKSAVAVSVKLIKDRGTGQNVGYGFIEFETCEIAANIYRLFNGTMNPATKKPFRLNWGVHKGNSNERKSYGGGSDRGGGGGSSNRGHDNGDTISVYFLLSFLTLRFMLAILALLLPARTSSTISKTNSGLQFHLTLFWTPFPKCLRATALSSSATIATPTRPSRS